MPGRRGRCSQCKRPLSQEEADRKAKENQAKLEEAKRKAKDRGLGVIHIVLAPLSSSTRHFPCLSSERWDDAAIHVRVLR